MHDLLLPYDQLLAYLTKQLVDVSTVLENDDVYLKNVTFIEETN
jgi:hypothetical protein